MKPPFDAQTKAHALLRSARTSNDPLLFPGVVQANRAAAKRLVASDDSLSATQRDLVCRWIDLTMGVAR
jgi:hypothetical protein